MKNINRRHFLTRSTLGVAAGIRSTGLQAKSVTPSEIEGPFYPKVPQLDKDNDLTRIQGKIGLLWVWALD